MRPIFLALVPGSAVSAMRFEALARTTASKRCRIPAERMRSDGVEDSESPLA
ncbi:hypothetical protein [Ideonella sp. A 288]|uniref:hypothetical protein n=1 Tax=Ideonella sp. A 288 TaxID=1962181 RepID=UPI001F351C59|nr:hypothetical protein [Ideonella sp. A 288]